MMDIPPLPAPDGPARLPLRWDGRVTHFDLWHFQFAGGRWIAAYTGDLDNGEPVPLRIESACVFGHVLRSAQCDCGFQLQAAMDSFARQGRGLLLYGVDQDARGLGIAAHFAIYAMRQRENLDTAEVYRRLNAPVDARSYEPVVMILRHLGVSSVQLLSNNPRRDHLLREAGFSVVNVPLEAPLDIHNMSTLMLEKEDLGYRWSFETHADWLIPLQTAVADTPGHTRACAAVPGSGTAGTALAEVREDGTWDLAARLAAAFPAEAPTVPYVVYLTDLPRADELHTYAQLGAFAVVVPFSDIPAALRQAADAAGIRIVDWQRGNAYREQRPQWQLVHNTPRFQAYLRDGRVRCVVTPASGGEESYAIARCGLDDLMEECARAPQRFGELVEASSDGLSAPWLELDPGARGCVPEDVIARLVERADRSAALSGLS
ncbi:hypothetical protein [Streptomyces cavernae]|uniref:hypothetical protein n=1 Tax=Streptomyces cavernae TaxID=2259034 RepID=UPI000FEBB1FC|nr:hypothetical protein [Streptomyces cavernae]